MKRWMMLAVSLLLMGSTGLALAQDSTPAAGNTAPSETPHMRVRNPKVKLILDRMKLQRDRIEVGVKNGKLTADEAATLKAKLKEIGEEMRTDFQQNKAAGQKGLTDDQITQINRELDANSTAIHDDKQDAAAAAAPAN